MIQLIVSKKCQSCPYFEAEVESIDCSGLEKTIFEHEIYCKNRTFCNNLEEYLKKEKMEK